MVLVTHNMEEAAARAERIAVLHKGRLTMLGTPRRFQQGRRTAGNGPGHFGGGCLDAAAAGSRPSGAHGYPNQ